MRTVREVAGLRSAVAAWRGAGERVALVPTMGALHAGHLALIETARRHADRIVASIFVNPKQFGPSEDLDLYPRQEAADAAMLADVGCDLLWAPSAALMYPAGFATSLAVAGVSDRWDGAARPGHFDGVATVVLKLFNQVAPDVALFGEKDWQQLQVIRRLVADLDLAVALVGVATQRDADGLALSSRNAYLSAEERARAPVLSGALTAAARAIAQGEPAAAALTAAAATLAQAGCATDYLALVDAETLAPDPAPDRPRRLLAAARLGTTRLIDNVAVE